MNPRFGRVKTFLPEWRIMWRHFRVRPSRTVLLEEGDDLNSNPHPGMTTTDLCIPAAAWVTRRFGVHRPPRCYRSNIPADTVDFWRSSRQGSAPSGQTLATISPRTSDHLLTIHLSLAIIHTHDSSLRLQDPRLSAYQ